MFFAFFTRTRLMWRSHRQVDATILAVAGRSRISIVVLDKVRCIYSRAMTYHGGITPIEVRVIRHAALWLSYLYRIEKHPWRWSQARPVSSVQMTRTAER